MGALMRAFGLLAAVFLLATAGPSVAALHGSVAFVPPPPPCTYPTHATDGCDGAQANGVRPAPNLQTYAALSGQTWTSSHPWQFNSPGVDYNVSYDPTLTLKHPFTDQASLPAGCVYKPTGTSNGGPQILCDRVGGSTFPVNATFNGWDFSDSGDPAHPGCVRIHFTKRSQNGAAPNASVRTFTNNKFQFNGQCITNQAILLDAEVGSKFTLIFKYNEVDGNWPTSLPVTGHVLDAISPSTGPSDIEYDYFHDIPTRPMNAGVVDWPLIIAHNFFSGFSLDGNGAHGAIIENLPAQGSANTTTQYLYNVVVGSPATPATAITTAFSMLSAHTPTPWMGVSEVFAQVIGNVVVTNTNSGSYTFGVALTWVSYFRSIGTYTIQDNWVDPSGSLVCIQNLGGAFSVEGFVDNNGGGAAGNTLTVTKIPNGSIYEGATFHILSQSGWVDAIVQPYGSTCDGVASTGTNANAPNNTAGTPVTYCLGGAAQGKFTMSSAHFGQTQNTVIGSTLIGGAGHENFNLTDGSTVTNNGIQWYIGAQCNNHA